MIRVVLSTNLGHNQVGKKRESFSVEVEVINDVFGVIFDFT
ncbi:MAG: hypothetical protein ACJA1C_001597 [Crocinitomicaceae bacterium]|jgi:hypothetical protein